MTTAFVLKAKRYVTSYRIDGLLSHEARPLFLLLLLGRKQKGSGEMQYSSFVVAITPRFWEFYCAADKGSRTARTAHDGFTVGLEATCVILIDQYCTAFTLPLFPTMFWLCKTCIRTDMHLELC